MVRLRYNGDVRTADLLVGDMEASRQLSQLAHLASRWQALAQDRRWPALILALHLILGAIYSAVVPLWEAYDEVGHFIHRPPRGRDPAALGAALGLSLLTKNSGLAFIPFVGLTLILAARQHSASWRRLILWGGVAFGVAALLSGPWYSYNLVRYGRPIIDRAAENPIIRTVEPVGESVREIASLGWMATLINNTFA